MTTLTIATLTNAQLVEAVTRDTIANVATAELVALWNAHNADKMIKKFADRKTAEKRILDLLAKIEKALADAPAQEAPKAEDAPAVYKARQSRQVAPEAKPEVEYVSIYAHIPEDELTDEQIREDLEAMKIWELARREEQKDESAPATIKARSAAEAIKESWKDAEVFAKRTQRHGVEVEVNGQKVEFKSVAKAFTEFNLPMSKHIRFRMQLKEAKQLAFEHLGSTYNFTLTNPEE